MLNVVNAKSRLEKALRERIKRKFSFENYKIDIRPSEYCKGNDIILTFSYQRMEKGDFSFMDFSEFDKRMIDYKKMIDYLVSKCVLSGSFAYLGKYNPAEVYCADGGFAMGGSDLQIKSIDYLLGISQLNNSPNDDNDYPLENIWMKKENNEWNEMSDEEYVEMDQEVFFDMRFLKSIIDVIQNEIYDYLLALCPDEYRLVGIGSRNSILAPDYDEPRSTEIYWSIVNDEIPF